MTHMICIRMLSQILDSADTIRFLDLFRIPVSRAEFDDSNKYSFFSHVFTKDSYLFHPFSPSIPPIFPLDPPESAQPGLRCWFKSLFTSTRKTRREFGPWWTMKGPWAVGYGWVAGGHEIGTGWGMAWGMGLGQSAAVSIWGISWRLYLQDSLKNITVSLIRVQLHASDCPVNPGVPTIRISPASLHHGTDQACKDETCHQDSKVESWLALARHPVQCPGPALYLAKLHRIPAVPSGAWLNYVSSMQQNPASVSTDSV
jgi:hypothetical protein